LVHGRIPELAAVFVGGAVGTLARGALATAVMSDPSRFPWQTFVVNILGAWLLGVVATRMPPSDLRRPLLGTGLCGGLTTFSTVQVETLLMIQHHHYALAVVYTVAGIAAGLAAVHLGRGRVLR
jgi:fluoride exporter